MTVQPEGQAAQGFADSGFRIGCHSLTSRTVLGDGDTTKDRRLLELELNNWIRGLVTEMTDPGDELQASHPLRDGKVVVEDIEDNPGFFRVKLYAVPHFQVEGMDVSLSLVSQMPKAKA